MKYSLTNILLIFAYLAIILTVQTTARRFRFPTNSDAITTHFDKRIEKNYQEGDVPLILTPLIKSGNVTYARNQAKITHPDFLGIEMYSGYFTVNESCGSNLFFWFFPAEQDPENAPVILYLQGGPGASSMLSVMFENSPIHLMPDETIVRANYSWSLNHNLIYIDNPIDVGFSFTENKECLPTEQTQVGNELHTALVQFFQLFPNLQKNEFFISGESYAGKYVPMAAYTIHKKNPTAEVKINLRGLAIGDGDVDMINQRQYSPMLYELGLVDEDGRKLFEDMEKALVEAIEAKDWQRATDIDFKMMDDLDTSLYHELTGLDSYYDYINVVGHPLNGPAINSYLNKKEIQRALHVGDIYFVSSSSEVLDSMRADILKSVAPEFVELLDNGYEVLLYNGQLDICVAYRGTRNFVNKLQFKGKSEFQAAPRLIWKVDDEVAGYVRQGGNLSLAMVRNAGHKVPADQPKWMFDLLTGFTKPGCVDRTGKQRVLREDCK